MGLEIRTMSNSLGKLSLSVHFSKEITFIETWPGLVVVAARSMQLATDPDV